MSIEKWFQDIGRKKVGRFCIEFGCILCIVRLF